MPWRAGVAAGTTLRLFTRPVLAQPEVLALMKNQGVRFGVASSSGAGGMYMNGTGGDGDQDTPTSYKVKRPSQRVSDLAGIDNILIQIRELIQYPLLHPEIYDTLQIKPPRGVLLHGPPGCGKSTTLRVLARELGFEVCEWVEARAERWVPPDDDRGATSSFAPPYESRLTQFSTFLTAAMRTLSLSHGPDEEVCGGVFRKRHPSCSTSSWLCTMRTDVLGGFRRRGSWWWHQHC